MAINRPKTGQAIRVESPEWGALYREMRTIKPVSCQATLFRPCQTCSKEVF